MQADKANERRVARHLHSPKAKAAVIELLLDARHEGVALVSGHGLLHVRHYFSIGVEISKRCQVVDAPTPQHEALCPQRRAPRIGPEVSIELHKPRLPVRERHGELSIARWPWATTAGRRVGSAR